MIFESHAHYDDKRYKNDVDKVLKNCYEEGITKIVNIGADINTSINSVKLAKKYDFVYATVGVHPHDVQDMTNEDIEILRELSNEEKVLAIGEIGLDYYYEHSDKPSQRKWFKEQLKLANELDMPVIIHSRDADNECYEIVKEFCPKKAVIHCFSGSKELAMKYIELGCYIGVGGVVTFKNAKKLIEVVKAIPLDRILLETDAPYLTPEPYRGERNVSTYLKIVAEKVANLKEISIENVENTTFDNAMSFYGLK